MTIRRSFAAALAALAVLASNSAAADASRREELHIESFSWGSTGGAGTYAPPSTPPQDSRLASPSTGRQAPVTLQSQELLLFSMPPRPNPPPPAQQRFLDVPPSSPFHASAGIADWKKAQETRGNVRPGTVPAAPAIRR